MNLAQAFRVGRESKVALTGAGGKTTCLFQLAHSLDGPVVVTSSTHLGEWQAGLADRHLVVTRPEDVHSFAGQVEGVTLFSGPAGDDQRLKGLDAETLLALRDLAAQLKFPLLVEADGSRQKPLKAPADHEPAIPGWVDTVIVVAGLSGLGKPLDEQTVHRPERFQVLSGLALGQAVTTEALSAVLEHSQGGLKGIPTGARKIALLNQAVKADLLSDALRIAMKVGGSYDACVIAALSEQQIHRVIEPTAGVLLAGGESSRYGQPKMLLEWRGKPLIRHVAETGLKAGLSPLVVVTGAVDEPVRMALEGLPVTVTHNPRWKDGQSTSVGQGLRALPEQTGSAVFLLADQPQLSVEILHALRQRHEETLAPVAAPRVKGKRANPVLFDRVAFADLLALRGDTGGRAVLERYPVEYLDWEDENLLFDIDTPEDYERLKGQG